MRSFNKVIFLFILMFLSTGKTDNLVGFIKADKLNIHYGVYNPQGSATLDVLYLHGFGDTFLNHEALFKKINSIGARVIAFDLPSHGKTTGGIKDDLNFQSFEELASLASVVVATVRELTNTDEERPLVLAGWSTGGLLAVRITQESTWAQKFPTISGLLLYAPGVAVYKCVGNSLCQITNETLTHDDLLMNREIYPGSPLAKPIFSAKLLWNAAEAWKVGIPSSIKVLTVVAGNSEDKYANSVEVINWAQGQKKSFGSDIFISQCLGARHELDNETEEYGGDQVKALSAKFLTTVINGDSFIELPKTKGPCTQL